KGVVRVILHPGKAASSNPSPGGSFLPVFSLEVLEGQSGMGIGPALALLLAGPAISLPNMLVIRSVMGTRKTVAYVSLVVIVATITGMIFGSLES
ncbi:MAG: permease, partial [Deltaproteobacteria bacterium]|nr:permease [Deltaproteobacteria bacterium]